jgi:hypothetical protein
MAVGTDAADNKSLDVEDEDEDEAGAGDDTLMLGEAEDSEGEEDDEDNEDDESGGVLDGLDEDATEVELPPAGIATDAHVSSAGAIEQNSSLVNKSSKPLGATRVRRNLSLFVLSCLMATRI